MKIALVGCGKQAPKHVSGLRKAGADIVVAEANPAAAKALAESQKLEWAADVDALIADAGIDAIDIATPTASHATLIGKALDAGKHWFCEKPLCESVAEARAIAARTRAAGLTGMVGYVYRFAPVFEAARGLFAPAADGTLSLGAPVSALFRIGGRGSHQVWKHRRATAGGAMSEMLVHMLDLATWYFGPLRQPRLVVSRLLRTKREIQGRLEQVDADDYVLVRARSAAGAEICIQADLVTPAFTQFAEVQFEEGTFMGSIQPEFPSFLFATRAAGPWRAGRTALYFGPTDLFEAQMAAFCDSVRSGAAPGRNAVDDSVILMETLEELSKQEALA